MGTDPRFLQNNGLQVYAGTELLMKGALEAEVSLITGYPGSPISDLFNTARSIKDLLKDNGILVQIANNEALGAARLNGSQMENIRAMVAMKSVGAHVASDGLALGNLSKSSRKGGALVLIGDDPWSDSTQVPSDSRYLAKHLHIPVMEPSTFQEMKDWIRLGLDLSQKSDLYITYLITTNLADGGGSVKVYPNRYPAINTKNLTTIDTQAIPVKETVVLSPRTAEREETLADRYDRLIQEARSLGVNQILRKSSKRRPLGFITSGLAYHYVEHVLETFGITEQIPILKFGITFPLDRELLIQFSDCVDTIFVIEEKRDFLESQVVSILKDEYQKGRNRFVPVWGKKFPADLSGIPSTRGLNPSILMDKLGQLFLKEYAAKIYFEPERIEKELELIEDTGVLKYVVPPRTPTFCPGCPHRDSSSALLEIKRKFRDPLYMKTKFRRDPVDLIFHGDTGCYTMLMFEPNQDLMHNYSGMGLGGGTGAGIDPFVTNKQVVFMGDSTFFHSGMIAISDAVKHHQDITFIILDNGTIAMTGHQPTPGVEEDILGNQTVVQSIDRIVQGMLAGTGARVHRINPANRERYSALAEKTILQDGVKVIIADKECGITYDRKIVRGEGKIIDEKGFLSKKRWINLSPDVCEFCLECTKATGCPGLTLVDTPHGRKLEIDLSWCKADGACTKLGACPSFSEATVIRKHQPLSPLEKLKPVPYPEPQPISFEGIWSTYVAGVGGMGIGVITAILVQAGFKEGYQVRFLDKKGLAIRNGGVYSHIHYLKTDSLTSPVTSYGKADLLLGLDILEAARSIDAGGNIRVTNPKRTVALINTHRTPTIAMLTGKEDFDVRVLENFIRARTREDFYYGIDLSCISENFLGNKLFSNLMMLGVAYQKGYLPIQLENLKWAIERSVRPDALAEDLSAFDLGRRLVAMPKDFSKEEVKTYESVLEQKTEIFRRSFWVGHKTAFRYLKLVRSSASKMNLDEENKINFAVCVYDLVQYENLELAEKFVSLILDVFRKDSAEFGYEATKAAIPNVYKAIAIKDEIYVAHLLTSEEMRLRNYERYQIDPSRGDRLRSRFLNQPEFVIFGKHIRFKIKTYPWQLRIMKHFKWLRRFLPGWHSREKAFRDWYLNLVRNFRYSNHSEYRRYINVLRMPEEVRGYRQVRYPKMEEARVRVQAFLDQREVPEQPLNDPAKVFSNTKAFH